MLLAVLNSAGIYIEQSPHCLSFFFAISWTLCETQYGSLPNIALFLLPYLWHLNTIRMCYWLYWILIEQTFHCPVFVAISQAFEHNVGVSLLPYFCCHISVIWGFYGKRNPNFINCVGFLLYSLPTALLLSPYLGHLNAIWESFCWDALKPFSSLNSLNSFSWILLSLVEFLFMSVNHLVSASLCRLSFRQCFHCLPASIGREILYIFLHSSFLTFVSKLWETWISFS